MCLSCTGKIWISVLVHTSLVFQNTVIYKLIATSQMYSYNVHSLGTVVANTITVQ